MRNKYTNEYYRILKAIFPLKDFYEAKFLKDFKNSLIEFSNEHPNSTFDDLIIEFGTPQEVLLEYMDTQDYLLTSKKIKNRSYKNFFVICIMIILFIGMSSYILFLLKLNREVERSIPNQVETIIEYKEGFDENE